MDIIIGNTDIELYDIMNTRRYTKKLSEDVSHMSDKDCGERLLNLMKIERFAIKAKAESLDERGIICKRIINTPIDVPGRYFGKTLVELYKYNAYLAKKCIKDIIINKYNLGSSAETELYFYLKRAGTVDWDGGVWTEPDPCDPENGRNRWT